MNNIKIKLAIDTLLKLTVVLALVVAATTKQQYSYYTFIRWLVTITFVYFIYKSYEQKRFGLLIYFAGVAIIFNPFLEVWFQKDTWQLIDYIISTVTTSLTIIYDWVDLIKSRKILI